MPKILCCLQNTASVNIAEQLRLLDSKLEIIKFDDSILNPPTAFDTDYILVLSSHKMKDPKPMLTTHFPGNWSKADFGGESSTLNIAYASKLKQIFIGLNNSSKRSGLNWEVSLEADHHGPTCPVPIIYVELGSSENEWSNKLAGKTVAEAVLNSLTEPKECESILAIGTGHYPKEFNKLLLETDLAISHILPKYFLDIVDDSMLEQAIEKSLEKITKVMVVKKSLKSKQKKRISDFCNKKSLEYIEI